jgi:hypothetical protein
MASRVRRHCAVRAGQAEPVHEADGPVHGDPRHELRVHEVLLARTHLPDAVVGLLPAAARLVGDEGEELPLQCIGGTPSRASSYAAFSSSP